MRDPEAPYELCWLVIDDGDVLVAENTVEEALYEAKALGLDEVTDLSDDPGFVHEVGGDDVPDGRQVWELMANAGAPTVDVAMRALNLPPIDPNDVLKMDPGHVFETLRPYMPNYQSSTYYWVIGPRGRKIERVRGANQAQKALERAPANSILLPEREPTIQYRNYRGMVDSVLGGNFKTAKERAGVQARILGLSLVPDRNWTSTVEQLAHGLEEYQFHDEQWRENVVKLGRGPRKVNACVGSSPDCRAYCLAYTGHNSMAYNFQKKMSLMTAFLEHPVEFCRLLLDACERFEHNAWHHNNQRKTACIRLNVFSDIPWERVFPYLFERMENTRAIFYDYTKVVGRGPMARPDLRRQGRRMGSRGDVTGMYDISFSYSGYNQLHCWRELQSGTRITVVSPKNARPRKGSTFRWLDPEGDEFIELKVYDGEKDDFRAFDAAPGLVSLPFKTGKGFGQVPNDKPFLVHASRIVDADGNQYFAVDSHLPNQTNFLEENE